MGIIATVLIVALAVPGQTADAVYKKVSKSVVKLVVKDTLAEVLSTGTAFITSSGDLIVTAAHVLNDKGKKPYWDHTDTIDGTELAELIGLRVSGIDTSLTVLAIDWDSDIALLRAGRKLGTPLQLSKGSPGPGVKVYTIGHALGFLDLSLSDGIVSARRKGPRFPEVQFTAPVSEGCSGAPLVKASSEVVGVVLSTVRTGQNLNFAAGPEAIRNLLSMGNRSFVTVRGDIFKSTKEAVILKAPVDSADQYFRLNSGEAVMSIGEHGSYLKILMANGATGYGNKSDYALFRRSWRTTLQRVVQLGERPRETDDGGGFHHR